MKSRHHLSVLAAGLAASGLAFLVGATPVTAREKTFELKLAHWVPRPTRPGKTPPGKPKGFRNVYWERESGTRTAIYDRSALQVGHKLDGPLIVEGSDTNYPVPPGWSLFVDNYSNYVIERQS